MKQVIKSRSTWSFLTEYSYSSIGLIIAFVIFFVMFSVGYLKLRADFLNEYGFEQKQAWNLWQVETERLENEPTTVARRAAKSDEPPLVVLLRDHGFACWLGLGLISSVIFLTFGFLLIGSFKSNAASDQEQQTENENSRKTSSIDSSSDD